MMTSTTSSSIRVKPRVLLTKARGRAEGAMVSGVVQQGEAS